VKKRGKTQIGGETASHLKKNAHSSGSAITGGGSGTPTKARGERGEGKTRKVEHKKEKA